MTSYESLRRLLVGQDQPQVEHDELSHLLGDGSVDQLGFSADGVALVVAGDECDHAAKEEDIPMHASCSIAIAEGENINTLSQVAFCDMDKHEQLRSKRDDSSGMFVQPVYATGGKSRLRTASSLS